MECKASDSKKFCKVFDATRRPRKNPLENSNSDTDGTKSVTSKQLAGHEALNKRTLEKKSSSIGSSSGVSPSHGLQQNSAALRSLHVSRRKAIGSLALKAGCVSTPHSDSPGISPRSIVPGDAPTKGNGSFIYDFLEEALKPKKKHKHKARRHEDRYPSTIAKAATADASLPADSREHRHKRRPRRHDDKDADNDQLIETFVKMLSQTQEPIAKKKTEVPVPKAKSHHSFQCQYNEEYSDIDHQASKLREVYQPREYYRKIHSRDKLSESGSMYNDYRKRHGMSPPMCQDTHRSHETRQARRSRHCMVLRNSEEHNKDRYDRLCDERPIDRYEDRVYEDRATKERYSDRGCDRDRYAERHHRSKEERRWYDDTMCREKTYDRERQRYPNRRYDERDRYDHDELPDRSSPRRRCCDYSRDDNCTLCQDGSCRYDVRHCRNNGDRNSAMSLLHADSAPVGNASEIFEQPHGRRDMSSLSQKKQVAAPVTPIEPTADPTIQREVIEQRQALDKMMRLWQELMRRFKDMTDNVGRSERVVQDTAAAAREVAATQAQLWRECMQRYESVARDVGDTDARLMEELQKQKSEITEMSSMWQECLSRYRDLSTNLTCIKQQINDPPPAPPPPPPHRNMHSAEGEGYAPIVAPMHYGIPPHQGYPMMYGPSMSPVRAHVSAPSAGSPPQPPWWWGRGGSPQTRRHSSLDSRSTGSRGRRERKHKHRERDREKEKDRERHRSKDRKPSQEERVRRRVR